MTNIAERDRVVTGGVDTHKDFHVAAALDQVGRVLGTQMFPATAAGYIDLGAWLASHGPVDRVGIEGTSSYGKNLTRSLSDAGVVVREVMHQNRARRRRNGKSDPADAINAARAVQAGDAEIVPKSDGAAEQIRMIRMVRTGFVKNRTQTVNQIHSIIDTAPEPIRAQLVGSTIIQICTAILAWTRPTSNATLDDTAVYTLHALATQWSHMTTAIRDLERQRDILVKQAAPAKLLEMCGCGTEVAAAILTAIGANPERFATEAGFAALGGVSPIEASSGRHQNQYRLNRGGNRDLNNALWRIVITRLAHDPETQAYMARRLAEGKSKRAAIRCLKRHVSRRIWKIFNPTSETPHRLATAA